MPKKKRKPRAEVTRPKSYSLQNRVIKGIEEAAAAVGKTASAFVNDTMAEKVSTDARP